MPNVLVRDLPDDVHRALVERADRAGTSLQQYLTEELTRLASKPSLDDVLDRIGSREGGRVGFTQAVEDIAAERARR